MQLCVCVCVLACVCVCVHVYGVPSVPKLGCVCMCNEGVFRMCEGDFKTLEYDPGSGEGDPRHTECDCGSY